MSEPIDHLMTTILRRATRTFAQPGDTSTLDADGTTRRLTFSEDYDPRSALASAREALASYEVDLNTALRSALTSGKLSDAARDALTSALDQVEEDPTIDAEDIVALREVAATIDAPDGYQDAVETLLLAAGRVLYDLDGETLTSRSLDIETGEVSETVHTLGSAADLPREAAAESQRMQRRLLAQLERTSDRARAQEEALARTEAARAAQVRALRHIGVGINEIAEAAGVSNSWVYGRTRSQKEADDAEAARANRELPATYKTTGPGVGVAEAARRLGLSEAGVRLRVRNGKLASTTYKGRLRILLDE